MKNNKRIKLTKDECEVIVGIYGEFINEQMIKFLDLSYENCNVTSIEKIKVGLLSKFKAANPVQVIADITSVYPNIWHRNFSFQAIVKKLVKFYG